MLEHARAECNTPHAWPAGINDAFRVKRRPTYSQSQSHIVHCIRCAAAQIPFFTDTPVLCSPTVCTLQPFEYATCATSDTPRTPHRIEPHTSPKSTAPSPTTAAPPSICDVDIPVLVDAAWTFRLFGREDLDDEELGVENEREEEESTNPICFRLSSAMSAPLAIDSPSDVERVDGLLDIAFLACWYTVEREFGCTSVKALWMRRLDAPLVELSPCFKASRMVP